MEISRQPQASEGVQQTLDQLNAPSGVRASNGLGSLDQADFLRLLTTQLTIQDPLEPVNNEEMLAQMAQFSSLATNTASGSTLNEISAKLDDLIAAQAAAAEAVRDAIQASAQGSQSSDPQISELT